ncbi:hypothetical protein SSX86_008942 [Deinandra increscens subsp. villosa]|uniref:F-box associated beta-propeller type 1 domain-containing protein n=1 Tax=Deinandra increscens subsp. villosa TaxID=3103831 RepID=A0AAP0H2I5_9ASTR
MGSYSYESMSSISERIFNEEQYPELEFSIDQENRSGFLNSWSKNSFRRKKNQVFLEGYVETSDEDDLVRAKSLTDEDLDELKGCFDLGFGSRRRRRRPAAAEAAESGSETASPPAAPIANWKISSPGDHPEEVKARLKYWAQAVACTHRSLGFQVSMAGLVVHDDIVEQILIELDVKDLIRYKSVYSSFHSYYNSPVVGSSNGLVCIFNSKTDELLVGNPLTREVRHLELPTWIGARICWGFGYDSSRDDYKVLLVSAKLEDETYVVQVLSLKSNEWSCVGGLKYTFSNVHGVLCNGALHWIVRDKNKKRLVIISYDLSKGEFKEIPHPDKAGYVLCSSSCLGIVKECLCICLVSAYLWVMKNYNVKESWKRVRLDHEMRYDIVHYLRSPREVDFVYLNKSWDRIGRHLGSFKEMSYPRAPVFVQSLVSPHVNINERPSDNKLEKLTKCLSYMLLKHLR